ncbi:MAG: adenylate kinase family protein [Candidatus Freyarchaeota archaeon]|nr:adenylate kinase family protein [Candidatus Jordarchaeia archaeon]MBS7269053.1 adenylate kinase family protein [Candidatus Jordarchaeia archaeon]MBS7279881.1 adenylate kinase family protein [Candidatus Jordarchaeia archaeon]
MGRAIIISGSPGTGKSTLSSILAKDLKMEVINLSKLVEVEELFSEIDTDRDTKVADLDRLIPRIVELIDRSEGVVIVEGHYADIVPSNLVDVAIILRTHPKILAKRLESKGWGERKISENVQAEILGSCTFNALEAYGKDMVYEIDTTNLSEDETASIARKIIQEKPEEYKAGRINWLSLLEADRELDEYFS